MRAALCCDVLCFLVLCWLKGWVSSAEIRLVTCALAVPGVGATGTAALLNVPRSLDALMASLKAAGYDLGGWDPAALAAATTAAPTGAAATDSAAGATAAPQPAPPCAGEALVAALKSFEEQRAVSRGAAGVNALGAGAAGAAGFVPAAAEVSPSQLKAWLTFPAEWGPTEWGPIPFLPDNDVLVQRMEKQWGELRGYRCVEGWRRGSRGTVMQMLHANHAHERKPSNYDMNTAWRWFCFPYAEEPSSIHSPGCDVPVHVQWLGGCPVLQDSIWTPLCATTPRHTSHTSRTRVLLRAGAS